MGLNSNQKGKRAERALRDELREAGFLKARRTQQYSGATGDASDVTVPELPTLHFESKWCENARVREWIEQAARDTAKNGKVPIVCHRRNHGAWVAILKLDDLLDIVRRSDLVQSYEGKEG